MVFFGRVVGIVVEKAGGQGIVLVGNKVIGGWFIIFSLAYL